MKTICLAVLASVAASQILAQESRELESHVHGVSKLELAVEGSFIVMNMVSPGIDIVGFEYEASTGADKDAVEDAIRTMLVPENIVALPDAADCRLTEVLAHLHAGDHDHGDEDEHADEPAHEEHAEGEGHEGDDSDGDHSEFHVQYTFACEHPERLDVIGFPFFEQFPNAQEVEAQYVTENGAGSAEIERDAAELVLN
ncbi:DUF2796 domain-containing protein [Algicella marina]|uniref:DUF2796 domain-containing protein n=1 Tax=Algicella marina TaxID=2683284 RepID=A0A6P1T213_9RHOB|nr:DUF2796 domain-containing protein [Algicella marina]QHQ35805.1 DUF2796 domain-containing protein [Algicella marina]